MKNNTLAVNLQQAVNEHLGTAQPVKSDSCLLTHKAMSYVINNLNLGCEALPCSVISWAGFCCIDDLISGRMIAYAAADIRGATFGNMLFSFARQQLHDWRGIFEGCVWVNGVFDHIEDVDYD